MGGNSAETGKMKRNWLSRFTGRKQVRAEKTSTFEGADAERSREALGEMKALGGFQSGTGRGHGKQEGIQRWGCRTVHRCNFTAVCATIRLSIFILEALECIASLCRKIPPADVYRLNWRGQNGCRVTGQ